MTVAAVDLEGVNGGWITIHQDLDGEPGPIVGSAAVKVGMTGDLTVTVNRRCFANLQIMEVKLLVVGDCPNEAPARTLLRQALDESNLEDVAIRTQVITDPAEAAQLDFLGSPSFFVDGRDLFADPGRPPGITCRVYPNNDGPTGLPTLSALISAVMATRPKG